MFAQNILCIRIGFICRYMKYLILLYAVFILPTWDIVNIKDI